MMPELHLSQIEFLAPDWLWLLWVLPLVWWLLKRNESRRIERASRLGAIASRSCPPWLAVLLFTISLCALSRPYLGSEQLKVEGRGRDLIIAVDVSLSMEARDLPPSRLEFAKRKMLDLLAMLERDEAITRVGIVLFSGSAYLYAPLTVDYAVLRHYIDSIDPDLITARGSAIDRALQISRNSLQRSKSANGAILLLTDGEDLALQKSSLQPQLADSPFPIHALGIGTVEGAPIDFQGRALRDSEGNIVTTKLRPELLIEASAVSGGNYSRASLGDGDLVLVLKALQGSTVEEQIRKNFTLYFEIGPLISSLVLLLLLTFTVRYRAFPLTSLLLLVSVHPTTSMAADRSIQELVDAYKRGNYEEVVKPLENYAQSEPANRDLQFALGNTYYKLQRFPEARTAFERAMRFDATGRDRFASHYNLGNTFFRENRFDQAVKHYEEALRIKPDDSATMHNLEIAKAKLKTQSEQSDSQQEQSESQKPEPTPTPDPQTTPQEKDSESEESQDDQQGAQDGAQQDTESSSSSSNQDSSGEQQQDSFDDSISEDEEQESKDSQGESSSSSGETGDTNADSPQEGDQSPRSTNPAPPVQGMQSDEARAWLDSLRDAPLLLQRKHRDRMDRSGGQIW